MPFVVSVRYYYVASADTVERSTVPIVWLNVLYVSEKSANYAGSS